MAVYRDRSQDQGRMPKLKQWLWEAKTKAGEVKKGEMEALDAAAVDARLEVAAACIAGQGEEEAPARLKFPQLGGGVRARTS